MRSKYIKETIRLMRQIRSEERLKKVYTVAVTLLRIEREVQHGGSKEGDH